MMKVTHKKLVSALLSATATTLLAMPAFAQTADSASSEGISDIVVTATRQEASVQDIGIAVSAFSQETLRNFNVTGSEELTAVTPGLQLSVGGGSPLIGLLSIRGVAQNDFAGHIEAPNAYYVNEVYQPSISTSVQQLYDVQRVEVLKGPQGTLFGRNATGGLVHIISNRPDDEFGGYAQFAYGNYDEKRFEGAINVPLSSKIRTRLSYLRNERNGFFKNSEGPAINAEDTEAARLQIEIEPNEQLKINLSADIYRIHPLYAGASFAAAGVPDESGLGQPLPPGTETAFGYVDEDGKIFTGGFDEFGLLSRKQQNASARIEYDFGGVVLTTLTSWSDLYSRYREDNDLSPLPITVFSQNADGEYLTQEIRLGKNEGRFRWQTGFYYLDIEGTYLQAFDIQLLSTTLDANYTQETKSWSLFGQSEYDLTDKLTLITGVRYTRDRKKYDYQNTCVDPYRAAQSGGEAEPDPAEFPPFCGLFIVPNSLGGAEEGYQDKHSEGGVSARLQLDYKVNDDLLLYASFNRGYKAFNYNAGFAGQAPLALARFKGEKLNAFEIGEKAEFMDRKVRLNAAAFYYDYKNYQAFDQRGLNFTLFNTDATVYGADAELTVQPGWGWTLMGGVSLLHTKVEGVPLVTGEVNRKAPQSPSHTFHLAAAKEFDLGAVKLRTSVNGTYTASFYSQLTNAPVTKIPSNWLVNGRIGITDQDERFELSVYAKNLFNEMRQIYAFDITSPPFGLVEKNYGPPRQYGVEARVKF